MVTLVAVGGSAESVLVTNPTNAVLSIRHRKHHTVWGHLLGVVIVAGEILDDEVEVHVDDLVHDFVFGAVGLVGVLVFVNEGFGLKHILLFFEKEK